MRASSPQPTRLDQAVVIGGCQELIAGVCGARVSGGSRTGVRSAQELEHVEPPSRTARSPSRAAWSPVIDYEDLEAIARIVERGERGQALGQLDRTAGAGNDDGKEWRPRDEGGVLDSGCVCSAASDLVETYPTHFAPQGDPTMIPRWRIDPTTVSPGKRTGSRARTVLRRRVHLSPRTREAPLLGARRSAGSAATAGAGHWSQSAESALSSRSVFDPGPTSPTPKPTTSASAEQGRRGGGQNRGMAFGVDQRPWLVRACGHESMPALGTTWSGCAVLASAFGALEM